MKFVNPDSKKNDTVVADWGDLIKLHKKECESSISMTKLTPQGLWPNNFEKHKVNLVLNAFDEKVVAALKMYNCCGTAMFIEKVNKMWRILNVKSRYAGIRLNDVNRNPIEIKYDERLTFLEKIATSFKLMD